MLRVFHYDRELLENGVPDEPSAHYGPEVWPFAFGPGGAVYTHYSSTPAYESLECVPLIVVFESFVVAVAENDRFVALQVPGCEDFRIVRCIDGKSVLGCE